MNIFFIYILLLHSKSFKRVFRFCSFKFLLMTTNTHSDTHTQTRAHTRTHMQFMRSIVPTSCCMRMGGASTTAGGTTVFAGCRCCVRSLILINDKCRILLLGDAHIIARVILFHNVPGSWIQQYGILIELRQLGRTYAHQSNTVPFYYY